MSAQQINPTDDINNKQNTQPVSVHMTTMETTAGSPGAETITRPTEMSAYPQGSYAVTTMVASADSEYGETTGSGSAEIQTVQIPCDPEGLVAMSTANTIMYGDLQASSGGFITMASAADCQVLQEGTKFSSAEMSTVQMSVESERFGQESSEMRTMTIPVDMPPAISMEISGVQEVGIVSGGTAEMSLETQGLSEMRTMTIPADMPPARSTGMSGVQQVGIVSGGTAKKSLETQGLSEMRTMTIPANMPPARSTGTSDVQQVGIVSGGTAEMSLETQRLSEMRTMTIPADIPPAISTGMSGVQQVGIVSGGTAEMSLETQGLSDMRTMTIPADMPPATSKGMSGVQQVGIVSGGTAEMSLGSHSAWTEAGANSQTTGLIAPAVTPHISLSSQEKMATVGSAEIFSDGQATYTVQSSSNTSEISGDPQGSWEMQTTMMAAGPHGSSKMAAFDDTEMSIDSQGSWEMTTTEIPAEPQGAFELVSTDAMQISADPQGSWEMTTMEMPVDSKGSFELATTEIQEISADPQGSWEMTTMAIPADSQGQLEMVTTEISEVSADQQGSWEMTTMAIPADSQEQLEMVTTEIPEISADQQGSWEMTTMAIPADSQGQLEMVTTEISEISADQQGSWEMTTMVIPADSQGQLEMVTMESTELSTDVQNSYEITTTVYAPEKNNETYVQQLVLCEPARQEAAVQCNLQDEREAEDKVIAGNCELIALKNSVETLTQRTKQLELEKDGIMEMYKTAVEQYEVSHTRTVQEYEVKLGQMRIEKEALERKNNEAMLEIQQLQKGCSTMAEEHQIAFNEQKRQLEEAANQEKASFAEKCAETEAKISFVFEGKLNQLREENEALLNAYQKNAGDYELKITKIQTDYEVKLGQVKMERDKFEDNNEDLIVMHNKTVNDYKMRIQEIEDEFKSSLSQMDKDKSEVESKRDDCLQEIAELKSKYRSLEGRYEVFVSEVEDEKSESQKREDEEEDAFETEKQELLRKHKMTIAEYEARIKEMRQDFETKTGRLKDEKATLEEKHKVEVKSWREKVTSLKERHKEEMRDLENEMLDRFDAEKDKMKARFSRENEELMEKWKDLIQNCENKITEIRQEYDLTLAQMEAAKCNMEENLQEKIDSLQQEMAAKENNNETKRKKLEEELEEKYSREMSEREATFVKERNVLIEEHNKTVSDCETTVKEIAQENEEELAQAIEERQRLAQTCDLFSMEINEWKKKCSSLEESHEMAIKELEKAHNRSVEEAQMENERQVEMREQLVQEFNIKIENLQLEHKTKVDAINLAREQEKERYKSETENWRASFTSTEETYEKKIQSIETEIRDILRRESDTKDDLTKEKEEMLKNHKNELKTYETNIANIHQDYQVKIAGLEHDWKKANEELTDKMEEEQVQVTCLNELHESRLEELKARMQEEWNAERQEMEENFLKEREKLNKMHNKTVKKYEAEIGEIRGELDSQTMQLETKKKTIEEQIEKLQQEKILIEENYQQQITKEQEEPQSFIKEKIELEENFLSEKEELLAAHKQTAIGYEENIKSLEQKLSDASTKLRSQERANIESENSMKATIEEITANFKQELEDMEASHKNEINNLKLQNDAILRQIKDKCTRELSQAVEGYEFKLTAVEEKFRVDFAEIAKERDRLREECMDNAADDTDKEDKHKKQMEEMNKIIKQHEESIQKSKKEHQTEIEKLTEMLQKFKETVKVKTERVAMYEKEKELELNSRRNERNEFEITMQLLEKNILEYKETIRTLQETVLTTEVEKKQITASYDELLLKSKQNAETKFFEETARLQDLLDNELQQKLRLGKEIQELLDSLLNLKEKYRDLEKRYALNIAEMNEKPQKQASESDSYNEGNSEVKILLEQQMERCTMLEKEKENLEAVIKDLTEKTTKEEKIIDDRKLVEDKVRKLEYENQDLLREVHQLTVQNEEYGEAFEATWDLQIRSSKLQEESKYWKTTYEEISTKQEQLLIENDRLSSEVEELLRSRGVEETSRDGKFQSRDSEFHSRGLEFHSRDSEKENGNLATKTVKNSTGKNDAELEESLNSFRLKVIFLTNENNAMEQKTKVDKQEKQEQLERYEQELSNERNPTDDFLNQERRQSYNLEQQIKEWECKIEEIRNKYQEETEAIREQLNERSKEFENEKEMLIDSFNKEREALQKSLEDQRQTYDREKEITVHQCGVEMLIVKETEIIKMAFEKEKYELTETTKQEKEKTRMEFERSLQLERDSFNNALERQQKETEALKKVKAQLEARMQDMERKQEEERYKWSTSFSDEKRRLQENYYASIEEVKKASLMEMAEMSKEKETEDEKKLQEEMLAMEKKVTDDLREKLLGESAAHEKHLQDALYTVQQERDASREKILELERKMVSLKELCQSEKDVITEQCEREKGDLQRKLEHEKEMLKLAHEATKAQLRRLTEDKRIPVQSGKYTGSIHKNGVKVTDRSNRGLDRTFEDEHRSDSHVMDMSHDKTFGGFKEVSGKGKVTVLDRTSRDQGSVKLGFQDQSSLSGIITRKANQEDKTLARELQKQSEENVGTQEGTLTSFIAEVAKLREDKRNLEREVSQHQAISSGFRREIDDLRSDFSYFQAVADNRGLSQDSSFIEHRINQQGNYSNISRRGSRSARLGYRQVHMDELGQSRSLPREDSGTRTMNAQSFAETAYGSYSAKDRRESDSTFSWLRLSDDSTSTLDERTVANSSRSQFLGREAAHGQRVDFFESQYGNTVDKEKIYLVAQRET